MSEQKNVKEPQQPVEEEKNDTTVAVPATVNEVATKHPLQNRWVLWYDNPKKRHSTESWEENLKNVYTFNTVEDFWCLYNNILAPTKLSIGSNYHLFKEGIRPMWRTRSTPRGQMLSLIGETLQDEDDICGAVVSNETLKYQSHADAAASGSSFQNEVLYEA
ncbi:hypothetical protein PInf_012047 [Phytophthora infestans]|nr:hypothetical protein PInf_012047 [Phytophthora infestans]